MATRTTAMRGFTAAVAHVVDDAPGVRAGSVAVAMTGEGADRCLQLMLRHADGTALIVHLSDAGLGRLGDLVAAAHDPLPPAGVTLQ